MSTTNIALPAVRKRFDSSFFVSDMTSLRYAIPFIKTAKNLFNRQIALIVDDKSTKYNSIRFYKERLKNIVQENEILLHDSSETCVVSKTLFCVESVVGRTQFEKCYAFQHAFDCLHKTDFQKVYLVTDQHFKDYFTSQGIESKIQPYPVVFWDWDYTVNFAKKFVDTTQKNCTLFYPQVGYNKQFQRAYDTLRKNGYRVFVKQRRKHQPILGVSTDFLYDDIWYPAESIFLPIASDITVGFETSAYTDLIHLEKDYVDFALPAIRNFYKPSSKHMHVLSENFDIAIQQFENIIEQNLKTKKDTACPFDIDSIKNFLGELLQ